MICKQPGCGYVFPKGMQVTGKCPTCEESPFYISQAATFTKEELEGRKIFPLIERGEISLFERLVT